MLLEQEYISVIFEGNAPSVITWNDNNNDNDSCIVEVGYVSVAFLKIMPDFEDPCSTISNGFNKI